MSASAFRTFANERNPSGSPDKATSHDALPWSVVVSAATWIFPRRGGIGSRVKPRGGVALFMCNCVSATASRRSYLISLCPNCSFSAPLSRYTHRAGLAFQDRKCLSLHLRGSPMLSSDSSEKIPLAPLFERDISQRHRVAGSERSYTIEGRNFSRRSAAACPVSAPNLAIAG